MGLIGSIMSLPSVIVFFAAWVILSLSWPFLLASLFAAMFHPAALARKTDLLSTTVRYLTMCNDKKWKNPQEDPASFFPDNTIGDVDRKTIIFVRHGESTWNDTFNRGDRSVQAFAMQFLPGLVKALFMEWFFFVKGRSNESWFYDAPLSDKGLRQAEGVRRFLAEDLKYKPPREAQLIRIMLGQHAPNAADDTNTGDEQDMKKKKTRPSSQLVSSNLRRAISTTVVGFQDRLQQQMDGDKIQLWPQLQEISRNPDALSITPSQGKVITSWTDPPELERIFAQQIDTSFHKGNKPVGSNGLLRMQSFCRAVFHDTDHENLVVAGHSLWFRSFFRTYLPYGLEHVSKKRKLMNGGCVGFDLMRVKDDKTGQEHYMIDSKTITVLYGGF